MRPLDRTQLVSDLLLVHPLVARLSLLLTGRDDLTRRITHTVMILAVNQWPAWPEDEPAPSAWFLHHTLLQARASVFSDDPLPDPEALLLNQPPNPEYAAFLRALRKLPFQQIEAFVLYDVLRHDLRGAAVAMDMSTTATANHLESARSTLKTLAADRYDALLAHLRAFAATHAPDDNLILPEIRGELRAHTWRRIWRWTRFSAVLAILAAIAYFARGLISPLFH